MKKLIPVVVGLLALGAITTAQAGQLIPCTNGVIRGNYSFIETGSIIGFGPLAGVGILSTDGKGHITSASQTLNVNGVVSRATATGVYSVNADCTGTAVITASNGVVLHADIAATRDGNTINFVTTDPGSLISAVDTRF